MNKLKKIEDQLNSLTGRNRVRLSSIRHPHRQSLKYYRYRVGVSGLAGPTDEIYEWLNENTTDCYSVDYTTPPHNISFINNTDAIKFKLTFGGTIACKAHRRI